MEISMTRQQKYQLAHKARGLCIYCTHLAVSQWFCARHLRKRRVQARHKKGLHPWHPGRRGRPPLSYHHPNTGGG